MNDEIVNEVRHIRERLYEETKNMTTEERREKTRAASQWIREQIAQRRVEKKLDSESTHRKTINC